MGFQRFRLEDGKIILLTEEEYWSRRSDELELIKQKFICFRCLRLFVTQEECDAHCEEAGHSQRWILALRESIPGTLTISYLTETETEESEQMKKKRKKRKKMKKLKRKMKRIKKMMMKRSLNECMEVDVNADEKGCELQASVPMKDVVEKDPDPEPSANTDNLDRMLESFEDKPSRACSSPNGLGIIGLAYSDDDSMDYSNAKDSETSLIYSELSLIKHESLEGSSDKECLENTKSPTVHSSMGPDVEIKISFNSSSQPKPGGLVDDNASFKSAASYGSMPILKPELADFPNSQIDENSSCSLLTEYSLARSCSDLDDALSQSSLDHGSASPRNEDEELHSKEKDKTEVKVEKENEDVQKPRRLWCKFCDHLFLGLYTLKNHVREDHNKDPSRITIYNYAMWDLPIAQVSRPHSSSSQED